MCQGRMQCLSHGIYPDFYIVTVIITQDFQNVSDETACANRVVVWETVTVYMEFLLGRRITPLVVVEERNSTSLFFLIFKTWHTILYSLSSVCFELIIFMRQIRGYLWTVSISRYILLALPKLLANILILGNFIQNLVF